MEIDRDYNRPLFGKTRKLLERINSLDEKWYVEFWEEHYYFFGIDVYNAKREIVKQHKPNRNKTLNVS